MKYLFSTIFLLTSFLALAGTATGDECQGAREVLNLILNENWKQLEKKVEWPIKRKAPLTKVGFKEFLSNPNQLFDESILNKLKSNDKITQLASKGCMTDGGGLWFRLGKEGKLTHSNLESEVSKSDRERISKEMTKTLPEKFRQYVPVTKCKTKKNDYQIFKNKVGNYILLMNGEKEKETLFFSNGKLKLEGSILSRSYHFYGNAGKVSISDNFVVGGLDILVALKAKKISENCKNEGYE